LIRVGTRGSALALAQAHWVAERIDDETELVTVTTAGDRGVDTQDKSRWVSELERALLEDRIDIAVHSAKDVPADLAADLALVAIPPRADARDAICGATSLDVLTPGARVGTSSLRRTAQIRALRQDLEVVPVRGNVDTRLRKLAEGQFDAIVLAGAGLERLGRQPDGILGQLVPAAGQGALAIEAKPGEWPLDGLNDPEAAACVGAERDLTRALDASCNTPIGAHARWVDGGELELEAWLGRPDGSAWLQDRVSGPAAEVGRLCAERLLSVGAKDLL
jgi:hydroxymethylbilane synthase